MNGDAESPDAPGTSPAPEAGRAGVALSFVLWLATPHLRLVAVHPVGVMPRGASH
jgi:hypothetical protein